MCKKLEDFDAYDKLDTKEKKIFDLMISGKTNKEIADILGLGKKKFEPQISELYKKIDFLRNAGTEIKDKKTVLMAKVIEFFRN